MLQCATCLEKQGVNLKDGVHLPWVSHEQGEIVYLDLVGPISEKISSFRYSAVLNTWVKGARGIPKTFHTDNGKELRLTWPNSCTIN